MSNGGAKKRKHQEPENKVIKQAKLEESIQDLTPRERQYLYSAGLHPVQLKKHKKKSEDDNSAQDFATRALGSSSQTTRHEAIERLQTYLSLSSSNNGGGISYLDIQKLWKGMWYGLYMCDKTVVQEELSSHMAKLIWSVTGTVEDDIDEANRYVQFEQQALDDEDVAEEEDEDEIYDNEEDDDDDDDVELIDMDAWEAYQEELEEESEEASEEDELSEGAKDENDPQHSSVNLVCLFVKGYFEAISREWGHMDKHRLDKFYRSMRLMMYQIFQYWASRDWHIGIIHMFNDVVFNPMLCEESTKFPNGVRFHLIDIVLKELATVSSSNTPIETEPFFHVLEPYLTIAMADPDKVVQRRVMENVLERFLLQHSIFRTVSDDSKNSPIMMLDHVSVEYMAEQIFEIASNSETADRYRSSLYQLHKLYRRQMKENSNIPQAEKTVRIDEEVITDQPVILDTAKVTSTEIQRSDEQLSNFDDNHLHEEEQNEENKKKKKKKKKKTANKEVESEGQIELGIKEAPKNVVNDEANMKERLKKYEPAPKQDTLLNSSSLGDNVGSLDNIKDGSSGNSNKRQNKKVNKNISNNTEGVMEKEEHPNSVKEDSEPPSADVPEPEVLKRKNKKKNKKQNSDDKIEFFDSASKELDDEIVISLRQQSDFLINAVNSINKSKKAVVPKPLVTNKQQKKADDAKERERQKRVKFGSVNRTKSYKASMTALQTMEHPATKTREPEKPILREPKYAPSPDVKRTVKEGNNRNAKNRTNKR